MRDDLVERLREMALWDVLMEDDAATLRAAAAALAERRDGWLPIADAPKDGTWLVLIHRAFRMPFLGRFEMGRNGALDGAWWDQNNAIRDAAYFIALPKDPPTGAEK